MSEEPSIARELQERINDFYMQNRRSPKRIFLDSKNFIRLLNQMSHLLLDCDRNEYAKSHAVTFMGMEVIEIKCGILLE